jgi:long-chain-fatty-acid--CoA ligase ACSBG
MHHVYISYVRGLVVGIYATNTPDACEYVAKDSQCDVIVVENQHQLQKILKVWPNLPHLKAIVQYTGEVAEKRSNVYSVGGTYRLVLLM